LAKCSGSSGSGHFRGKSELGGCCSKSKGKVISVLESHATAANSGVKVKLHVFMIWTVGGGEWLSSRSDMITPVVIG
jgi:hypothetical protein